MIRPFRSYVLLCLAIVLLPALAGLVSAASVPQITGISPSGGPITGGTIVTITGQGFINTTDVRFGGKPGSALTIVSDKQLTIITPQNPEGTVPISIINIAGIGGSLEPTSLYEYDTFPFPRLSGVSPSSGPGTGGTVVTITGSGFTDTDYVKIGENYGMDLKIIDDSHLTVRTQASSPGTVPISMKNAHGVMRSMEPAVMYTYEYSLPELTNISPSSGSIAGGTLVTIKGSGFSGTKNVQFGGESGTSLNIVNDSCLTIITPPDTAGTVAISVINPAGIGVSLGSAIMFHYEEPIPKLTSISPDSGSTEGGTIVTITGSWFNGTRDVQFGGKSGTGLKVIDNSHLTIITPASSAGTFPVSITNGYGTGGSLGPATLFRYGFSPTTTSAMKNTTLGQGHSNGGEVNPGESFPATSSTMVVTAATAPSGIMNTPGFEAIAGLSAFCALILLRKTTP